MEQEVDLVKDIAENGAETISDRDLRRTLQAVCKELMWFRQKAKRDAPILRSAMRHMPIR